MRNKVEDSDIDSRIYMPIIECAWSCNLLETTTTPILSFHYQRTNLIALLPSSGTGTAPPGAPGSSRTGLPVVGESDGDLAAGLL